MIEKEIYEEKRIKEEDDRIKDWEINFDAEQAKKEEELLKKFNNAEERENQRIKDWEINFQTEQKKKEEGLLKKFSNKEKNEITDDDTKRDDNERN